MSIASVGSQMRLQKCTMALCVAPVSVMNDWVKASQKFLSKFVKNVEIVMVHGGNKSQRNKTVRNAWKKAKPDRPCLIVSSWGLVTSATNDSFKTFLPPSGRKWDLIILDEAHQIRVSCREYVCHWASEACMMHLLTFLSFSCLFIARHCRITRPIISNYAAVCATNQEPNVFC